MIKEYKLYLSKIIEKKLGKKIDFLDSVKLVQDDATGPRIIEWNLSEPQPTEAELEAFWESEKQAILLEQAIKKADRIYYPQFLQELWENFKTNNSTYKQQIKDINKMTYEQLETYLNV